MKPLTLASLLATALIVPGNKADGHGTPINAYVHSSTGQLAVFDGYEPGELESFGGSDIFTHTPGIGVSSPVNGIAIGESLYLNVVEGLLFWDGSAVTETSEAVVIDWPDDGGTTAVDFYHVTANTGYQTGMLWGNYQPPGGTGSWDAHGDYALESSNPPAGIYGVALQLASPSYINSEPFLLSLVYDPLSAFSAADIATGIAELTAALTPLPTADFDRDTRVDAADLGIWQTHFATGSPVAQVEGDATDDGIVAGNDFLAWQMQWSAAHTAVGSINTALVPEPSTAAFAVMVAVSLSAIRLLRI